MFEIPVSNWTKNLVTGPYEVPQKKLSHSEIPEKTVGGIPSKTDALYPC
jgi:hypothetical protein